MNKIACFITPHGFGHATRLTAVLEALQQRQPELHPLLFTTVPESLFGETLATFSHHPLSCDIGLVQKNGLETDLPETLARLEKFLPFNEELIDELATKIEGCRFVLCDIAPLGIAVAKRAAIPSVLIENFTWDWIYRAYLPAHPQLQPYIDYLTEQYRQADIHIRTDPVCGDSCGHLHCGPIFRRIRTNPTTLRKKIHCGSRKVVLISMGGVEQKLPFLDKLHSLEDTFFLIAGQKQNARVADNIFLLDRNSGFYHPDLINAADLVICKSGYSTVAECFQAGVPVVTVGRATFPESPVLAQFCSDHLAGQSLKQDEFLAGDWLNRLDTLHNDRQVAPASENGAVSVADHLMPLLS